MQMNTQSQAPKKILIIGGGFAGIAAARSLVQEKIPNVSIQLVSKRNHFEYYPGLYRVVTGASPIEVCIPLTDMIPDSVTIDIDTITKLSLTEKYHNRRKWYDLSL
jgi:NADH dehydrogenase FAD-containing subunit